ncbi:MAG TPA: glycosyltransferase [Thermoanaerobaculia bacterium]|nr:glycosyltransferase [Thermoanaerobaculia bacterium]
MKLVIFGLTISSSWGNGHATLWRALCSALAREGHRCVFFERDRPYYRANRDVHASDAFELVLYDSWPEIADRARRELAGAEAGIVTSYCIDAMEATALIFRSPGAKVFYDLDAPITLDRLERGETVEYLWPEGLGEFDLVLSYTGGTTLDALRGLGGRNVYPLYGSVDPLAHRPVPAASDYRCRLSYLGTYAADRQEALARLFLAPARSMPEARFLLGGAMYPQDFPWSGNIWYQEHVPPPAHPAFFSSSDVTLNVTRGAMARRGYCPSGRLFEAAACGVPILSDDWPGLSEFLAPGEEILIAADTGEAIAHLRKPAEELAAVGAAARARVLREHTAAHRAAELVGLVEEARRCGA